MFRALAGAGVPSPLLDAGMRPHVTLLVCDAVAPSLEDALAAFAHDAAPLPAVFAHAGTFHGEEGVVFAAPVVTQELLDLHRRAHAELGAHCRDLNAYYGPGQWVPHCTQSILLPPEQVARGLEICREALPIRGTFARIGLHRIPFDVRTLDELFRAIERRPPSEAASYPCTLPLGG